VTGPSSWTLEELRRHLQGGVELEWLTIPAYLTALYSIHPGSNAEAALIIRSVVVEEMLHMTLAANVLNAVGGRPEITGGYAPRYPAAIPYHDPETFEVGLQPFGDAALEIFLAIENPSYPVASPAPAGESAAVPRVTELAREHGYRTIGEFYAAIERGLRALEAEIGHDSLFTGEATRQVRPEHYYASGGHVIVVQDLETALNALEQIVEQGEGEVTTPRSGEKFDADDDLAHYYRFNELRRRRRYHVDDEPDDPTGKQIELDLDAVYPMRPNLRAGDIPPGELRAVVDGFNAIYASLLEQIERSFDGNPAELAPAVGTMFELKYAANDLLRTPLRDGSGQHAGPTFEYPARTG
jgi:hypothetical protein